MKFSPIQRENLEYVENLYQTYRSNPEQIDDTWQAFFSGVDFNQPMGGVSSKELDVYHLIQAYRDYGHFAANVNPLRTPISRQDLAIEKFNLTEADLDQNFQIGSILGLEGASLKDIVAHLRRCYCGTLAVQTSDAVQGVRDWFYEEIETHSFQLSGDQKKEIFKQLCRTESLEKFLHTRFVGAKRFSVEGGDSLIPLLEHLASKGREEGLEEVVIGMAHRGRLNVLVNFMEQGK